jgi:hypothetical protein
MSNRHSRRAAEARQKKAAYRDNPGMAALVALHESLTTPDSEDWTLLVDGESLYLTAVREREGTAYATYVTTTVSGLKAGGTHGSIENFKKDHGLGCLTVILPSDAEERGGFDLLFWLTTIAKQTNAFSLTSITGCVPTAEAVETWKAQGLRFATAAGEA